MAELHHRSGCPLCGGRVAIEHCNACHRLFGHCESCEAEHPNLRDLAGHPGTPLPPAEHPTCPRCQGVDVRPATRSDLDNRDMLDLLS